MTQVLPFDGAVSRFFSEEVPEDIRSFAQLPHFENTLVGESIVLIKL